MDKLPQKWAIRATTKDEAKIIAEYATEIAIKAGDGKWTTQDALDYYLRVNRGVYDGGTMDKNSSSMNGFTIILFSDFERLVLNQSIEPTYEIY